MQGGKKVMCWGALINGKVILHWFPLGVNLNQEVYMDMLQTSMWPKVRSVATRQRLWFQQDGATCHTTLMLRTWLSAKFGDRIISRFTARPWPSRSPCLSPLDYWFWSVCLAEVRKNCPASLDELINTVNQFACSLEEEAIRKACNNIKFRAQACIESDGGPFEFKLNKMERGREE